MVRREILAVFEGNRKGAKSPKPEKPRPPRLICMRFRSTSTCMNFFSWFYFWPPWTIVHGPKGNQFLWAWPSRFWRYCLIKILVLVLVDQKYNVLTKLKQQWNSPFFHTEWWWWRWVQPRCNQQSSEWRPRIWRRRRRRRRRSKEGTRREQ